MIDPAVLASLPWTIVFRYRDHNIVFSNNDGWRVARVYMDGKPLFWASSLEAAFRRIDECSAAETP
jgi:hypothetical protein